SVVRNEGRKSFAIRAGSRHRPGERAPLSGSRRAHLLGIDIGEAALAVVLAPGDDGAARAIEVAGDRQVACRRSERKLHTVRPPLGSAGRVDPLDSRRGTAAPIGHERATSSVLNDRGVDGAHGRAGSGIAGGREGHAVRGPLWDPARTHPLGKANTTGCHRRPVVVPGDNGTTRSVAHDDGARLVAHRGAQWETIGVDRQSWRVGTEQRNDNRGTDEGWCSRTAIHVRLDDGQRGDGPQRAVQPVREASGRVWRRASPILPTVQSCRLGRLGLERRDRSPWRVGSTVHVGFARWWSQRIETLDLLTTSTVRNQRSATRALQGFHARTGLVNARLPKRTSSPSPPITPSRDLPSQNAEATAREPVVASTRSPTVRLQLRQPKWWS